MEDNGRVAAAIQLQKRDLRQNVFDLTPEKLTALLADWGEPPYRARQVLHWVYKELVTDFSQMTNLPLALRSKLEEHLRIGSAELVAQKISSDGWTRKVLLKMRDGSTVEAVLMLYHDRATVCVSSQVGCAMGCTFCATGQMGFTRNLTSGEIVEQVIWFNRWLRDHPHRPTPEAGRGAQYGAEGKRIKEKGRNAGRGMRQGVQSLGRDGVLGKVASRNVVNEDVWHTTNTDQSAREIKAITNIVFMGMGEPLVNYANLWGAIRTLNSPQCVGLGARRLTVSTVGIVPRIRQFAKEELAVNLAVSLHASNDALRSSMVPINLRYPIADLMAACRDYVEISHRRITFEYVLINGVNDSLEHAAELRDLLKGMLCHLNLIPLNPVPGTGMSATHRERVFAFQKVVEEAGISTTVRIERGVDIAAACGQLKVEEEPNSKRRSLNPELVRAHVQADLASTSV
ncbi:MAG TPA: 23S rRNA (adenine(2503)-C(2))-methyltransferase RlmN [Chloroflexia bacterium]|nr:23S rRNA (adenine(2503)-C(2))-methyltransferase RlmN [Chloroflexia bacterium]